MLKILTQLRLNGPRVTDADLAKLSSLRQLQFVNAPPTGVTPEGISSFELTDPGCRVPW